MRQNIFILFDVPDDRNDKEWLIKGLSDIFPGHVKSVSIKYVLSQMIMIKGGIYRLAAYFIIILQSIRTILLSKRGDIIICWFSTTGKIFNFISSLLGNNRYIVSLNWLNPGENKSGFHYWIARKCISNPMCTIVFNTPTAPQKWNQYMDSDRSDYLIIPDVFDDNIKFEDPILTSNQVYFTGGYGNRDWALLMKLASQNPNSLFICVAQKADFYSKVDYSSIPKNVEVYFNTTEEEYYSHMKRASIMLLPIIGNNISGLVNILRAAQLGLLCCTSITDSCLQYYSHLNTDLLVPNDIDSWNKLLQTIEGLSDCDYGIKVKEFQNYIKKQYSPTNAVNILVQKINNIINNEYSSCN